MGVHFVVPYYLDPRYLFELIESVLKQTRDDWLLTILDDQYPGTAARDRIAELADPRISYVRNERNLGATANVCQCLTKGRLDYIVVMGADDALEPNYVEVVEEAFARHPNAIMVHPGVTVVDDDSNPTDTLADRIKRFARRSAWQHTELDAQTAVRSLMRGNWLYVPSIAFRNDAVSRATALHDEFGSIGDLAWVVDMLLEGGTLAIDKTPAFRYRRRQGSHSSSGAKNVLRFDEEHRYYTATAARLQERGWTKAATAARWHVLSRLHATQSALGALSARDAMLARALLGRALRWS